MSVQNMKNLMEALDRIENQILSEDLEAEETVSEAIHELEALTSDLEGKINEFDRILRNAVGWDSTIYHRFKSYPGGHIMAALGTGGYGERDTTLSDIIQDLEGHLHMMRGGRHPDEIDPRFADQFQDEEDDMEESYLFDAEDFDSLLQTLKIEGKHMIASGYDASTVATMLASEHNLDSTDREILYLELIDNDDPGFIEAAESVLGVMESRLAKAHSFITLLQEDRPSGAELRHSSQIELPGALSVKLQQAQKRYDAARLGMKIVGKMPPGPERAYHNSRIIKNLNILRGELNRAQKELDSALARLGER